jgi:mycothiol synthase
VTAAPPAGYRWRAVRPADDLDAVVALFDAADLVDVGFVDAWRDLLMGDWTGTDEDPPLSTNLMFTADGALAGYVSVGGIIPREAQQIFLRIHPAHREAGLGRALLAWSEAAVRERLEPGDRCRLAPSIAATDRRSAKDLEAAGYDRVRTFWHMEGDLTPGLPDPELPPGIHLRPFVLEVDGPAFHEVIEEAFAEHFRWVPSTYEEYRVREMHEPWWDPSLVTFAVAEDGVAGAVAATQLDDVGWIGEVGVRSAYRGRGVGAALLNHAFAQLAARGLSTVRLTVDAGNETGATRLYERVGMRVRREWRIFEKLLAAD